MLTTEQGEVLTTEAGFSLVSENYEADIEILNIDTLEYITTEDGEPILSEDGQFLLITESSYIRSRSTVEMAAQARDPHELNNLIHQHDECSSITGFFPIIRDMADVSGDFPFTDRRFNNTYRQIIREVNRKLYNCDLIDLIDEPYDGGLYPETIEGWIDHLGFTYTFDFELS